MTDEAIIKEAARLVDDGVSVTFPVKGRSMLPFITGGKDSVILQKPDNLRRGHVVLAEIGPERYVVHRIISISPDSGHITLMGDGNIRGTESCTVADVLGMATHVVSPDGRKRSLVSRSSMAEARVWFWLLPVRRWLLAGLRRINRKKYT